MPIKSSEITENTLLPSGSLRVKFNYIFHDEREFPTSYINANDQSHVDQLLSSKGTELELSVRQNDAQEAITLNIQTAHKDASQEEVYFAYLFEGYTSDDVLESYNLMSKVAPQILSLGLTVEQMAIIFNQTIEMAQAVFDKWEYLDDNRAVIIAYGELNV